MSDPTGCGCARACSAGSCCARCDLLVGLPGLHVTDVGERDYGLIVTVESPAGLMGCAACGVVAESHGRRVHELIDAPSFGRPVRVRWRKRTWSCSEPSCGTKGFTEQDDRVAAPRALLTTRACWWAIRQIRRENASVQGIARQLGTTWRTVWSAIKPLLEAMDADPTRFNGVRTLGVDEHIWHHVSTIKRGPKELTGMVDLTRHQVTSGKNKGQWRVRARLLDLVPGRSGVVYADWLKARNHTFRDHIKVATLDPFQGYKNAIDDELEDATAVLDAFHVVKLGTDAVDDVRRRVQHDTLGHRGRKGDPLYSIMTILRCNPDRLTDKQKARLTAAINAHEAHEEVSIAWQAAQQLRSAYAAEDLATGRTIATKILDSFPNCPIPEIRRLGKTLNRWKEAFLAYFTTGRANNGGTEAINGLIELHRRVARGFRNRHNYRLRMLLIGGGLTHPEHLPPPQV
ncbi:ISL3 family transposase [Rudaeicoccus suwonensis]|uniref:Transposase n=1 Tax=Rudaeicoccus suwonensis TaxID=657409 RepID=A0A561E4F2_9MICO|nr:ISL3 family transposase [Rudaeicoccus suwonensis]TWE10495.1 transposase [Rudaeicoccus suwonensis]